MSSTCVFVSKLLTQYEGQSIETEGPEFGVVMASGSNQSAFDRVQGELGIDNWWIKGMEFTAHEGRVLHGQGSSSAVANRGADHMYATFYSG